MIFLSADGKPKPNGLYVACVVTAVVALLPATSKAAELEQVAVFEQWPAVSQFITYRNRIWFVNSEPYKDTNVADILVNVNCANIIRLSY